MQRLHILELSTAAGLAARCLQLPPGMQPLDTIRWRFLAVIHFFIGVTAMVGGGALVVWWRGTMLQLPLTLLDHSPFTDFLLPGLILYGVVGLHNLIAGFLMMRREPGAELISFSAGSALLIWIAVETAMVDASQWLQFGYGALALLVVLDAVWLRRMRGITPAPQIA